MAEVLVDVVTVDEGAFTDFRSVFGGELLRSTDAGYETARRVWNGNIDRRPAVIARCRGVADVQRSLAFAVEQGLQVSVRGGGHSAPGYGTNDGGLVIDLGPMKGIRVDPAQRVATAISPRANGCSHRHERSAVRSSISSARSRTGRVR